MMTTRIPVLLLALVLSSGLLIGKASAQDTIKVGYWTSGFSVGFGPYWRLENFWRRRV